ncbi:MAG: COR domain-containing protein, partial [Planctomycetaceae bacterium]|nr:COR domain-containing protein [Planctomycetaceae bacterium]
NSVGPEGARALATLQNLNSLYLNANSVGPEGARALLVAWADSPRAAEKRRLTLKQNGDLSSVLPPELVETEDAQELLAAFRRFRGDLARPQGLTPLNEAKLLVLGNEAVGKTSLIRYLVDNQPRNPSEPKTPSAKIREKIETRDWSVDGCPVTLHVWDFGGQEIMHGTHRFFLTERSLYLVVLEARREDDRSVYDWLKTIRNRGGDSPVIVVINKCDLKDHLLQLNEKELREEYGVVAFARTQCDDDEASRASIAALRELIARTLKLDERLKHVRDPMPQAWLRIKAQIAELARRKQVLETREYLRLCETTPVEGTADDRIATEAEQRVLLRLLHDLGTVVAHGLTSDAPAALREITLLDPNWLTGAIYTLLTHPTVRDQQGELRRAQLTEWLDADLYPQDRHEFILDMMQHPDVGLMFELPGEPRGRYLIPEALPKNPPHYEMWPKDALRFRFEYDFLPPGLIPRFIVQAHEHLSDQPTRWYTGVVLQAAGCPILVRGDRNRERIDIAVAGPAELRRAALNIVLNELMQVHRWNPEIRPDARVPLPDKLEESVPYEHLLRLEGKRIETFFPEKGDREYTVRELLEGVRLERGESTMAHESRRDEIHITASDGATIQVVTGADAKADQALRVAGRSSVNPDAKAKPNAWELLTSWPAFSAACGGGAVAFVLILWALPTNEWRAWVGGLAG